MNTNTKTIDQPQAAKAARKAALVAYRKEFRASLEGMASRAYWRAYKADASDSEVQS